MWTASTQQALECSLHMTTIPYYWNGRNVTDSTSTTWSFSVYQNETLATDTEKPHVHFIYNCIQTTESSLALSFYLFPSLSHTLRIHLLPKRQLPQGRQISNAWLRLRAAPWKMPACVIVCISPPSQKQIIDGPSLWYTVQGPVTRNVRNKTHLTDRPVIYEDCRVERRAFANKVSSRRCQAPQWRNETCWVTCLYLYLAVNPLFCHATPHTAITQAII